MDEAALLTGQQSLRICYLRMIDQHHQRGILRSARGHAARYLSRVERRFGQPPGLKSSQILRPILTQSAQRRRSGRGRRNELFGRGRRRFRNGRGLRLQPIARSIAEVLIDTRFAPPIERGGHIAGFQGAW